MSCGGRPVRSSLVTEIAKNAAQRQSHCFVAVGLAAFSKNSFWSFGPVSSRLMARIALAIRADEARVAASPRAAVAPAASP